mgnify:CR=1 FL=1
MEKKTILVVEDEKAIADILVFNLQREGYDTIVAYDGTEGLRHALEDAPDLILLDVMAWTASRSASVYAKNSTTRRSSC